MPQKVPGAPNAIGYWGRSILCRVCSDQTGDKVKATLIDKLLALPKPTYIWLPVSNLTQPELDEHIGDGATFPCTCDKDTASVSDDACRSCHGVRIIPGYVRFLTEVTYFSSAEAASYTLTGCELNYDIKPNRILMSAGTTSATIETNDKAYTNPDGTDWETEVVDFIRAAGNTVTAEFSTDGGGTWTAIASINGASKPIGTGTIRFRVTLARTAASDKSPAFEIIRMRRVRTEDANKGLEDALHPPCVDYEPGQVLIARTWVQEQTIRDAGRGRNTNHMGDKMWTMPLDFFDTTITPDTPAAKIDDRKSGPHPFYEIRYGVNLGDRYTMHQGSFNENFLTFTHQAFVDRFVQIGENLYKVF
jgi:hypothetical protein